MAQWKFLKMETLPIGKSWKNGKRNGRCNGFSCFSENIIIAMQQVNKHGESKLLPECTLPLTGVKCIKKIVTELGVYEVKDGAFHCLERAPEFL